MSETGTKIDFNGIKKRTRSQKIQFNTVKLMLFEVLLSLYTAIGVFFSYLVHTLWIIDAENVGLISSNLDFKDLLFLSLPSVLITFPATLIVCYKGLKSSLKVVRIHKELFYPSILFFFNFYYRSNE